MVADEVCLYLGAWYSRMGSVLMLALHVASLLAAIPHTRSQRLIRNLDHVSALGSTVP